MDFKNFKSLNWASVQSMFSMQSSEDLNAFLEKLPQNTSKTLLVITGIVWGAAAAMGLFSTVQAQGLTKVRAELQEAKAVKPSVPKLVNEQVPKKKIEVLANNMKEIFKNLEVSASGSSIVIGAGSTARFGEFREAIGHVQNKDLGWIVNVDKLCVGRECGRKPLAVALKITRVNISDAE